MKKLIVINYGVLEKSNPNAACMLELAKYLQEEFEIHFFTDNIDTNEIKFQSRGRIKIHAFPVKKCLGRNIIDVKSEKAKNYINQLSLYDVFACISVSFPFLATVKVMNLLKKLYYPKTKTIIYELDPLAFNGVGKKSYIHFGQRIIFEAKEFFKVDAIWLTRELFEDYKNGIYKVFNRKMVNIGIPLLSEESWELASDLTRKENSRLQIVYTGTFYDSIRKPDYLIEIIKNLTKVLDVELHVYGNIVGQESYNLLQNAKRVMGEKLILHGNIKRNEIPNVLSKADFLVNVGNSVSNQAPSKIFEYIKSGKPIINISSIENDSSNYYLNRYPLALSFQECWEEEKLVDHVKKVVQFCMRNAGKKINNSEINILYNDCMVSNIAKHVRANLEELVHER